MMLAPHTTQTHRWEAERPGLQSPGGLPGRTPPQGLRVPLALVGGSASDDVTTPT